MNLGFSLGLMLFLGLIYISKVQSDLVKVHTELIILHNNDMHARFEEINAQGITCTPEEKLLKKCYGGFARLSYLIKHYREQGPQYGVDVLYLNAGDTFTGSLWYTVFRHKIITVFLNHLRPDAIALGTHEFTDGIDGLRPFIENAKFPIVAANLNLDQIPQFDDIRNLYKSVTLNVSNTHVGVIGYLTPETQMQILSNNLRFTSEISAINKEAAKLKLSGVKIIIALGHSGFKMDLQIAEQCPEVDLVIGGQSHSFLSNQNYSFEEVPISSYPHIVWRKNRPVPVVQAFSYTKYLGKLVVQFDKQGNLLGFDGQAILLDDKIPQDPETLDILKNYTPAVDKLREKVVGQSKVSLEGGLEACQRGECNLGNVITDAMVHARARNFPNKIHWTDAPIGLFHSGGIDGSIQPDAEGNIHHIDIINALRSSNKLVVAWMFGEELLKMLEISGASVLDKNRKNGFLQVSGLRVFYDFDNPQGSKVIYVDVRCSHCSVPKYRNLVFDELYGVVMPIYVFKMAERERVSMENHTLLPAGITDSEALLLYLKEKGVIYTGVEGRINFLNFPSAGRVTASSSSEYGKLISTKSLKFLIVLEIFIIFINQK